MSQPAQLSLAVQLPDDETFASFYPGDNAQLITNLKNAAIGQGFAAAGGGEIDAEKTVLLAAFAQAFGEFKGAVLPGKGLRGALAKGAMHQPGQLFGPEPRVDQAFR